MHQDSPILGSIIDVDEKEDVEEALRKLVAQEEALVEVKGETEGEGLKEQSSRGAVNKIKIYIKVVDNFK